MGGGSVTDIYGVVDVQKLTGHILEVAFQREGCVLWGQSAVKSREMPDLTPLYLQILVTKKSLKLRPMKSAPKLTLLIYSSIQECYFQGWFLIAAFGYFWGWMREIFAKTFRAQMVLFSQKKCMAIWDCALGHKAVLQGKKCALCQALALRTAKMMSEVLHVKT